MGRVLGAFLLVLVAGCSSQPSEVTGPTTPTQWFDVGMGVLGDPSFGEPGFPNAQPHRLRYAGKTDLGVHFRNAGETTLSEPTVEFEFLSQDEPESVVISAGGDGWTCSTSDDSATCSSDAQVEPGDVLPPFAVAVEKHPDSGTGGPDNGHRYRVTFANVVYQGILDWDTAV